MKTLKQKPSAKMGIRKNRSVASDIVSALADFADGLKSGQAKTRFTRRVVSLDTLPRPFSAAMVKKTRRQLGLSQVLFAEFLGVAPQTVRSWEQGVNPPSTMACRFMDEILRNPEFWTQRLRAMAAER